MYCTKMTESTSRERTLINVEHYQVTSCKPLTPQCVTPVKWNQLFDTARIMSQSCLNCTHIHTMPSPLDLWTGAVVLSSLLAIWADRMDGLQ